MPKSNTYLVIARFSDYENEGFIFHAMTPESAFKKTCKQMRDDEPGSRRREIYSEAIIKVPDTFQITDVHNLCCVTDYRPEKLSPEMQHELNRIDSFHAERRRMP